MRGVQDEGLRHASWPGDAAWSAGWRAAGVRTAQTDGCCSLGRPKRCLLEGVRGSHPSAGLKVPFYCLEHTHWASAMAVASSLHEHCGAVLLTLRPSGQGAITWIQLAFISLVWLDMCSAQYFDI